MPERYPGDQLPVQITPPIELTGYNVFQLRQTLLEVLRTIPVSTRLLITIKEAPWQE